MPGNNENSYWQDRLILISLWTGYILNIILWGFFLGKFGFGRGEAIPLHFNVVYGIDLVGSSRKIFSLPFAGLATLLVNTFLGRLFYKQEKFFSYFFSFSAVLVQLFLAAAAFAFFTLFR